MINLSLLILGQSNIVRVLMRMPSIVLKKTMTSSLASGLNVAVYSYSRFISLVIKLTCYNSQEPLTTVTWLYHYIISKNLLLIVQFCITKQLCKALVYCLLFIVVVQA